MTVSLIWAQARDGVIGADGGIPWHLPEDSRRFRALTTGGAVVMGRITWDSLPTRFRPLPGRRNIVVTRNESWHADGAERASSLEHALAIAGTDDVWVIGGGQVYEAALSLADRLEVTELDIDVRGDAHAPAIDGDWRQTDADPTKGWHVTESGVRYRFLSYARA